MSEWLAMGGHAAFIWPAYAASLLTLVGLAAHAIREYRGAARGERDRSEP